MHGSQINVTVAQLEHGGGSTVTAKGVHSHSSSISLQWSRSGALAAADKNVAVDTHIRTMAMPDAIVVHIALR